MTQKLVSVVIPTKNRYDTLIPLIKALEPICKAHDDLEIIIQDNSECNDTVTSFFANLQVSNIKYYYESKWLSVGDNSDLAILHSSGEYISFIGDDDAFTEHIVDAAKIMKEKGIDACGCDYALFRWPAALVKGKNSLEYSSHGKIARKPDLDKALKQILNNGIQSKANLPCVYHGLVKRDKLFEIYNKTGTFFPGPSPDMANSFALSVTLNNYLVTSMPFIIDGYSKASTGHLSETKAHIGKLEDQPFLPKDTIENWSEMIPKIWLPNTIWPESAIQALKRMGREDLIDEFNYTAMYIKIAKIYPQCRDMCNDYIKKYSGRIKFIKNYIRVGFVYIKNCLSSKLEHCRAKGAIRLENEIEIDDAVSVTADLINHSKMVEQLESIEIR